MKKNYLTMAAALFATATFAQTPFIQRTGIPHILQSSARPVHSVSQAPVLEGLALQRMQESQAKISGKNAPRKAPAAGIITEQPEGELKHNLYGSHKGFYVLWGSAYSTYDYGMADDAVFAADGSVYFKNPFVGITTNTWLKGTLADDGKTINVALPQPIYYQEADGEYEELTGYAWKMNYELIYDEDAEESYYSYVADTVDNSATFTYENGVISYNNPDGWTIIGMCSDAGAWYGYGDFYTTYEELSEKPALPATNAEPKEYVLNYVTDDSNPDSVVTANTVVKVYKDGDDLYINELGGENDGVYAKMEKSGDKYVVKTGQYLGVPEGSAHHLYTEALAWKSVYDDYYEEYSDSIYKADQIAFDYAADADTYTGENNYLSINYGKPDDQLYTAVAYKKPILSPFKEVNAAPAKPTITMFADYYASYGLWYLKFDLTTTDAEGNVLNPSKLSYKIFFDDEEFTFFPDEYENLGLDELTEVPYSFTDNYDIYVSGQSRQIYFFNTGFQKITVQEYYKGSDGKTYSSEPENYYLSPDGIKDAAISDNGSKAASVAYYDLAGRQVSQPQHGVYVKTTTFADGTVKSAKTLVK